MVVKCTCTEYLLKLWELEKLQDMEDLDACRRREEFQVLVEDTMAKNEAEAQEKEKGPSGTVIFVFFQFIFSKSNSQIFFLLIYLCIYRFFCKYPAVILKQNGR